MPKKTAKKGCGIRLPEEKKAQFEPLFDSVDVDGTGCVSCREVEDLLKNTEDPPCDEDLDKAFDRFDRDRDGQMDKLEFFDFLWILACEGAAKSFAHLDQDGDNFIEEDELKNAIAKSGINATPDDFFNQFGAEDRKISQDQFMSYMLGLEED